MSKSRPRPKVARVSTRPDTMDRAPQPGDQELPEGTPAPEVVARLMLLCNDQSGVLVFRHRGRFFMRVVSD